jgi:hypothetical protein
VDEESIFAAALGMASPAERRAFLAEACPGDAELRGRVVVLLQAFFFGLRAQFAAERRMEV